MVSILTGGRSRIHDPARLDSLRRSGLLDTPAEESFDRLTRLAAAAIGVPVALVSLVDEDRQFFKSCLGLPEPWASRRETPLTHSFCQHVVDTARPLIIEDAREDPVLRENLAIRDLGVVAYAGFPLVAPDGQVLGSVCAIDDRPRRWTPTEIEILRDATAAATTEVRLRYLAEETAGALIRLSKLDSITDVALSRLPLDELLEQMAGRVATALDSDTATVLLREDDELAASAAVGLEQEVVAGVRVPVGEGFAGRVAAENRPLRLGDDVHPSELHSAYLRENHPPSMLGVPMTVDGEVIGVLHVGSHSGREFDSADVDLLLLAADRLGLAIEQSRRYEREHEIAETLQLSALPPAIPAIAGLVPSVRYLPAGRATHVGGDWYDLFALEGRRAGLSVGDIAGHGISAAAEMSRIRTALQAYLFETADPAEALRRVDRLLLAGPPGKMATAVAMTVDAETDTAWLAAAGHLPPILLDARGVPSVLDAAVGAPLGIPGAPARMEAVPVPLATGATLVLYSDGLVERRDQPIDACIARLADVVAAAPSDVEALSDHVIAEMLDGEAPADDVALLVVRRA